MLPCADVDKSPFLIKTRTAIFLGEPLWCPRVAGIVVAMVGSHDVSRPGKRNVFSLLHCSLLAAADAIWVRIADPACRSVTKMYGTSLFLH